MSGVKKRKATSSLYDAVCEKMITEGDTQMEEYLKTEAQKVQNVCDSVAKKYKKAGETETSRELLVSVAFESVRNKLLSVSNELKDKQLKQQDEQLKQKDLKEKQLKQQDEQLK